MTQGSLPSLADLARGHQLPPAELRLTAEDTHRYLDATEDRSDTYGQASGGPEWAPPLAIAALALRTIMERVRLPAGAIHTSQEVEFHRPVPVGASLRSLSRVAQRSEMRGAVVSVVEFEVGDEGAPTPAVVGRATVMMPQGETPS